MKLTACKYLLLLLVCLGLTGCGTIISLSQNDYSLYGGVSRDFETIREGGFVSILAIIDLPLSFVLDSLMLPVTLAN